MLQIHDTLKEQIELYNIERENFDRRALAVKEQGERDQHDSEKIGFFKANKERVREELKLLRVELQERKQ